MKSEEAIEENIPLDLNFECLYGTKKDIVGSINREFKKMEERIAEEGWELLEPLRVVHLFSDEDILFKGKTTPYFKVIRKMNKKDKKKQEKKRFIVKKSNDYDASWSVVDTKTNKEMANGIYKRILAVEIAHTYEESRK